MTVTDRAREALLDLRATEQARPDQVIGVDQTSGGRVSLVLDVPEAADRILSWQGVPILFVAAALAKRLDGSILDYGGDPGRERFTLEPSPDRTFPPAVPPRRSASTIYLNRRS